MKVEDIMTIDPATCGPATPLIDVARQMVDCDCGMIPVVDDSHRALGAVTDRDITCRAVAKGLEPSELSAKDVMTSPCVSIDRDEDLDAAADALEEHKIRRLLVVDDSGRLCGILSQADLARNAGVETAAQVVRRVSQPTVEPSRVH